VATGYDSDWSTVYACICCCSRVSQPIVRLRTRIDGVVLSRKELAVRSPVCRAHRVSSSTGGYSRDESQVVLRVTAVQSDGLLSEDDDATDDLHFELEMSVSCTSQLVSDDRSW